MIKLARGFFGKDTCCERAILLIAIICFSLFFAYPEFLPESSSATTGVVSVPSLEISPASPLIISTIPGLFSTGSQTLSVTTTNYTGYTLAMETSGPSTSLTHETLEVTIPTITLPQGVDSITQSGFTEASYGYSTDGINYKPVPAINSSAILATTNNSNNGQASTSNLTFGVLVAQNTPAGTYQNVFTLTATANASNFAVHYAENAGTDTVSNFPSDSEAYLSGATVTLSSKTPTREGYIFSGWNTSADGTGTAYGVEGTVEIDPEAPNTIILYAQWTVEETYACYAAGTLHTEVCARTDNGGCSAAGYAGQTITYGSLVDQNSGVAPGNAFVCDVNSDGTYSEADEMFYYVAANGNNGVLIYHKNISNANENYAMALTRLPTTSTWSNTDLVQFDGLPSRFLTYNEARTACDNSLTNLGTNGKCIYLLERSNFATTDYVDGWWLGSTNNARVQTAGRSITTSSKLNGARPAIEVPLSSISLEHHQSVAQYTITFNAHGGSAVQSVLLDAGDTIDSSPTTTYAHHLFQGWFTAATGGTQITFPVQPAHSTTYHAQWLSDVTLADISNVGTLLVVGNNMTVQVTNSAELEPYTFASSNTGIATIDSTTGVLTGVSEGTVTITMTGTTSHETKTFTVEVVEELPKRTVTYNAQGGTPSRNSDEIVDNTAIGSLPTATKTDNIFFGWYTDTTYNTEVTPETVIDEDVTFYARWVESTTSYPVVWYEPNACTFNGGSSMTGTYCSSKTVNNVAVNYIDTNIQLFIEENYDKDFEIGFSVIEYDPTAQVSSGGQATFVNSKQENSANNYPGFVFRRYSNSNTNVEITQKWKGNNGATKNDIPADTLKHVRIIRRTVEENGVDKVKIYYAINGSEPVVFQDITSITRFFFDTEVWFGASATISGTAWRPLVGTLTDMYIKLGTYVGD